uniref:Uncharacterized protein n=1 Tax=Aegilops tauschii subsp. strangulata TaxID=200361 RepID=A0A452YC48_AEGTS
GRDFERFCSNRVLHKGECSAADPRRRASIFSPNTGGLVRSKGLMFHEYQHIPESFKELIKNIRAQDVQVRIPRIG